MNWSRSPSSTFWVAEVSTLVRRSLMRLWSSTYERIWWPQPTSVFVASRACCCSMRLRISCSYMRERSICQASSRLRCCERSFWHCTTIPVGMCVRRTAESVLLMCWPPAPDAR